MNLNNLINLEVGELLLKHNLLIPLIKGELIESKIKNIEINEKEINNEIKKIWDKNKINNQENFEKWLISKKLKEESIRLQIKNSLRLNYYCKQKFSNKVQARFLERKSDLDDVMYSLIRLKDILKANELYYRIIEKESKFETISTQFSEGIERDTCGLIGPCQISKTHPLLRKVLKSSKIGEVSKPFMVDNWVLIIRVESYNHAKLDSKTKKLMIQELFEKSINDEAVIIMEEFLNKKI